MSAASTGITGRGGTESEAAELPGSAEMVCSVGGAALSRSQTILLVEDEAFVREVTVKILKSAGYAVLTASDAAQARALYGHFCAEVDLLLSDVILPDDNGRTLARELRGRNPKLPTLLVTGYAEQMQMQMQMKEPQPPGEECLPKPFSAGTLLQKVRSVLEKSCGAEWYPAKPICGVE